MATDTLVTLPAASSLLADIKDWANPIFGALWPFATIAIGLTVGIGLILLVIAIFKRFVQG